MSDKLPSRWAYPAGLTLAGAAGAGVFTAGALTLADYASVGRAETIGDLIAANSHSNALMYSFFAVGAVAALIVALVGMAGKHKPPHLATFLVIFLGLAATAGVGFKVALEPNDAVEDKMRMKTLAWDDPAWDNLTADNFSSVMDSKRLNVAYTAEEFKALPPEQQELIEETDNYYYRGEPLQVSENLWLQQKGTAFVCLFDSEDAVKTLKSRECVRMDRDLEAYRTADETSVEGSPAMAVGGALGVLAPLAGAIAFGGVPAARRRRLEELAQARAARAVSQEALDERWAKAEELIGRITLAWGELCSDPLSALDHSALLDSTQPRTAKFIMSLAEASDYQAVAADREHSQDRVEHLEGLARAADLHWQEALRYSSQLGTSWMNPEEQKLAATARRALELALDERNSVHERMSAAERARKLLAKLAIIKVPAPTALALENLTMLALTPAPERAEALISENSPTFSKQGIAL